MVDKVVAVTLAAVLALAEKVVTAAMSLAALLALPIVDLAEKVLVAVDKVLAAVDKVLAVVDKVLAVVEIKRNVSMSISAHTSTSDATRREGWLRGETEYY